MKYILVNLILAMTFGCASTPSPMSCNEMWDQLDSSLNGTSVASINKIIHPESGTYLGRNCVSLSSSKGDSTYELIKLIDEHRENLNSWTEDQRNLDADRKEDPEFARNIEKNLNYSETQPIPFRNEEVKEMIQDLQLKQSIFKILKKKLAEGGRDVQYLVPIHFKMAKDWINSENSKKDERRLSKLMNHLDKKEKLKIEKESKLKTESIELNAFLSSAHSKFKLSKEHFALAVVRGDLVDNLGLNLGQTIYKITKSRILNIMSTSFDNNRNFTLKLQNSSNQHIIVFNFSLNNYAILENVESEGQVYTDTNAMTALITAMQ
ncbi:MAG: hypothetical protein WC635_12470 [Bacteriovorax sp.]|jgi:hypothetical protein